MTLGPAMSDVGDAWGTTVDGRGGGRKWGARVSVVEVVVVACSTVDVTAAACTGASGAVVGEVMVDDTVVEGATAALDADGTTAFPATDDARFCSSARRSAHFLSCKANSRRQRGIGSRRWMGSTSSGKERCVKVST